jgi:hypothetical protein
VRSGPSGELKVVNRALDMIYGPDEELESEDEQEEEETESENGSAEALQQNAS